MSESRELRNIAGPKRNDVTGEWERLRNKELTDLYSPPNIIRVIKWRRMKYDGHMTHMGLGDIRTWFWWGNVREGNHLEDPGKDGRIILILISGNGRETWTGLI